MSILWTTVLRPAFFAAFAILLSCATLAKPIHLASDVLRGDERNAQLLHDGLLFFSKNGGVWRTDGTAGGTLEIAPGVTAYEFAATGPFVYFSGVNAAGVNALWRTDGLGAHTGPVTMQELGHPGQITGLAGEGGRVYFTGYDPANGYSLWVHDLTSTRLLRPLTAPLNVPFGFKRVGDAVVFAMAAIRSNEVTLWTTDGTTSGTVPLKDITVYEGEGFHLLGGVLLFSAAAEPSGASKLWRTDGTAAGTFELPSRVPSNMVTFRDRAYYATLDLATGSALWSTDGTVAGTGLAFHWEFGFDSLSATPNGLVFASTELAYAPRRELFVTDGTLAGTRRFTNLQATAEHMPRLPTVVEDKVFFTGGDASHGRELWVTGGREGSTRRVAEVTPGPAGTDFRTLAKGGRGVFYGIYSDAGTDDLWYFPLPARPADADGNGRSDLLFHNSIDGRLFAALLEQPGRSGVTVHQAQPDWKVVADADFDGDGVSDILWRHAVTGQVHMHLLDRRATIIESSPVYREPDTAWKIVASPDLDGDGNADLVWWHADSGHVYLMLMEHGNILRQGHVYREADTRWRIIAAGDLAGSGRANQLVWRHEDTGVIWLMTIDASTDTFAQSGSAIYREPDTAWRLVGVSDLDGNGTDDLVWRHDGTGLVWGMLMDGETIRTQGAVHYEIDFAWRIAGLGDYDGDGKSDLLWRHEESGRIKVMLMDGLRASSQVEVYHEPNLDWRLLGLRTYPPS